MYEVNANDSSNRKDMLGTHAIISTFIIRDKNILYQLMAVIQIQEPH